MNKWKLLTVIGLLLNLCCNEALAVCASNYVTVQNTCLPIDVRCGPNAVYFNGACNAVNVVPGFCGTHEIALNNCCCPVSCVLNCVQMNLCACCPAAFAGGNLGYGCMTASNLSLTIYGGGFNQSPPCFSSGWPTTTLGQPPCQTYPSVTSPSQPGGGGGHPMVVPSEPSGSLIPSQPCPSYTPQPPIISGVNATVPPVSSPSSPGSSPMPCWPSTPGTVTNPPTSPGEPLQPPTSIPSQTPPTFPSRPPNIEPSAPPTPPSQPSPPLQPTLPPPPFVIPEYPTYPTYTPPPPPPQPAITYPPPPTVQPPSQPSTPTIITPPLSCPAGTILIGGKCQLIYCPPGSAMHNDRCVHFECPPGLEWNGIQCVTTKPIEHHLIFNHSIVNYFNDTRTDITLNTVNNLQVNASLNLDVSKVVGRYHSIHGGDKKDCDYIDLDNDDDDHNMIDVWQSGEKETENSGNGGNEGGGAAGGGHGGGGGGAGVVDSDGHQTDNDGDDDDLDTDDSSHDSSEDNYHNVTVDGTSKVRCCIVISPRICRPITGTNRWSCHSRRQRLCGTICTAPKIVIRAPRIQYHDLSLVMPPMFYSDCRYHSTSIHCPSMYRGEYYDCSGCATMIEGHLDSCSPYCYRYNCLSSQSSQRCNYYDQELFCARYRGHFGCQQLDGCFDDWC